MTGSADRGVSSTVGTVLLVATVVLVSATVAAFATGYADELREPSLAAVEAESTTVDFGGDSECDGPRETVVEVTLTQLQQADRIYVIVASEGDEQLRVLWDDPGSSDVGETLVLANEPPGSNVDVDFGGGGDFALCPGDPAVFEFYAETDGQTTILQRLEL
jgi:FlaG/FlaF family flagellin (archaellin)